MARLKILSSDDYDKLYSIPKLTDEEREFIFELDEMDKTYLNSLSNTAVKINYILLLGYFRTSQYFFSFTFQSVKEDARFIIKTYFEKSNFPIKQINTRQYYANRQAILDKYEATLCSKAFESELAQYLKLLVKQHSIPQFLFDSLIEHCHSHKVIRPAYSTLQGLISNAWYKERLRISNKLYTVMDQSLRQSLDGLLKKDDLFYYFTLLKKDQKDFTTNEIRSSVEKNKLLFAIYHKSISIIAQLDISEQNVIHYAELAIQYTIHDLRNLKQPNLVRLYLLCYVHCRFLKINDHLVASFVHKIGTYVDAAEIYQKEAIYLEHINDKENRNLAANILSLNISKKVADDEIRRKAFAIVPQEKFQQFIQRLRKSNLSPDHYRWQYYNKVAAAIKVNIRMTFRALDFQSKAPSLRKAIDFLKAHFNSHRSFDDYSFKDIPLDFISPSLRRFVVTKEQCKHSKKKMKTVNADCYEFMLYTYIEKKLDKGVVVVKDSLSYKSLNDELISEEVWDKEQVSILEGLKSQIISTDVDQILLNFKAELGPRYLEVNQNISSGLNNKINIKYTKSQEVESWKLPYNKAEDGINNPFYVSMSTSSISQIIQFANVGTDFMKKFTHILPTYAKRQAEEAVIAACLVAKGTGNDIYKMKDISDITEQDLVFTYTSYIRHKTLVDASDVIMNKVAKLAIFEKYTLAQYGIHASVDGQKLETRYNLIQARHSSKYYGLGKGISAYTLFANFLPLCTKVIGSNEHESHYLLDALRNNTSDIDVSAVSGDMHSINRVNFALLYMFGYRFMPRFTNLDQKARNNMVSFDDPKSSHYKGLVIKPSAQVNMKLVIQEKSNILRILATLGIKKSSQSSIIKKLSGYKSNDTLKALIELDRIIMTLYILDYIDSEKMRQCVHRSLNRGESYHQLRSAIAKVSGRKIIGKNEIEIAINNECARLLAICIIFYNASLLSGIYEYYQSRGMIEESGKVLKLSPVAWQHISLIGKYEFRGNIVLLDLQETIAQMINKVNLI